MTYTGRMEGNPKLFLKQYYAGFEKILYFFFLLCVLVFICISVELISLTNWCPHDRGIVSAIRCIDCF